MVLVSSAHGCGSDCPLLPRRDAAGAHPGRERAAPTPVCARLLLPRRGLHHDAERRSLRILPRGLHRQRHTLRRHQRGAPAPTARTILHRLPPQLPTAPTTSFSGGGARPEGPSPPGAQVQKTSPQPEDTHPNHCPDLHRRPPRRTPSKPGTTPLPPGVVRPNNSPHHQCYSAPSIDPSTTAGSRPQRHPPPTPSVIHAPTTTSILCSGRRPSQFLLPPMTTQFTGFLEQPLQARLVAPLAAPRQSRV